MVHVHQRRTTRSCISYIEATRRCIAYHSFVHIVYPTCISEAVCCSRPRRPLLGRRAALHAPACSTAQSRDTLAEHGLQAGTCEGRAAASLRSSGALRWFRHAALCTCAGRRLSDALHTLPSAHLAVPARRREDVHDRRRAGPGRVHGQQLVVGLRGSRGPRGRVGSEAGAAR
jgi:hypothetical protein